MTWHKALLRFRVALAVIVFLVSHVRADDTCIWCDPGMSRAFLDCVYVNIQKSPDFGKLPLTSMDDMKNSIIAAAGAMVNTPDPLKTSMMNGAMAGELAELIKAQSVSQDPEILIKKLLGIVGNCYFDISGQSHHKFTGLIGSAVTSMLQSNADSGGPSPTPSQPSQPLPAPGGQNINLYNNRSNVQAQQLAAANQAVNYENGVLFYPNAVQNYRASSANIQSNTQAYSLNNNPQNIPQQLNFGGSPYPLNQQNRWMLYEPNTGFQPGITNVNLNNNQNGIPNNAAPFLQNNQFPIANYDQNNKLYPIPNQNSPLTDSTGSNTFVRNGQGIPDWRTLNQGSKYPSNQARISQIQTDKSVAIPDALNTAPQPNLNPLPIVSKSPSPLASPVINNPVIITDRQVNIKPKPNVQPKTTKKIRKPKRPRAKMPKASPATGTNKQGIKNGNNDDVERAIKFAETIYFILTKSSTFTGTFNKDLTNDDAASFTFYMIQNALNDCGYSKFSLDIAKACVVSLPVQCASEIYAEAISKSLMTEFYKLGMIGINPTDQGSALGIAILKQLQQISSDSPTTTLSTDSSTNSIITTTSNSNDDSVTPQDSITSGDTSGSVSTDTNTQFYNALYSSLFSSFYFRTIFSKQATKSDVISWAVQMMTSLYADYGKQILVVISSECAKRLSTLPDNCPLELYAKVICNCVTDVLSDNGLISQATPADQAKSIVKKFNTVLIKIINKITDNTPKDNSQLQNNGNRPIVNLKPQNTDNEQSIPQTAQNIPNTNKQPDAIIYGDNSYPLGDKNFILQNNQQPMLRNNPVNSITNLNAGRQILQQNNDSPANLATQDIYIDNKPTTQIFPDDDSDESKQRIQVLMKWAISSIENRKFNYKIFSSVISALAKYLQKTHPELGPQKALFKVLLESIVACTQLLIQAPQNAFVIQDAPNANAPSLQNTNVRKIKNINIPFLQNSNTPPSQIINAPPLQNANAPLLQNINPNVPNSQNANNAPLLQNTASNLPIRTPDMVQNNQNYPGPQQNIYNNGEQGNTNAFATGLNKYASQQDPIYSYQPSQQFDGNSPRQGYIEQQPTVTRWNTAGKENPSIPVQNNYGFQQQPAPDRGNFFGNGQNNSPAPQIASGMQGMNANSNRGTYNSQNGINDQFLNQQNNGLFSAGNPNQNVFPQNNNMQGGYQNY